MNWWMELIWVGNTLWPRWYVYGIITLFALTVVGMVTWLTRS